MPFSDWLMSCQAWLPRARYSQWARCKYWRPAVYFLYKMACLNSFYLKYCQTYSTGISIWQKNRCRSYLLVQNFEVIWWETALLSLSQNTGVYKEQKRSQPMISPACASATYSSTRMSRLGLVPYFPDMSRWTSGLIFSGEVRFFPDIDRGTSGGDFENYAEPTTHVFRCFQCHTHYKNYF